MTVWGIEGRRDARLSERFSGQLSCYETYTDVSDIMQHG